MLFTERSPVPLDGIHDDPTTEYRKKLFGLNVCMFANRFKFNTRKIFSSILFLFILFFVMSAIFAHFRHSSLWFHFIYVKSNKTFVICTANEIFLLSSLRRQRVWHHDTVINTSKVAQMCATNCSLYLKHAALVLWKLYQQQQLQIWKLSLSQFTTELLFG